MRGELQPSILLNALLCAALTTPQAQLWSYGSGFASAAGQQFWPGTRRIRSRRSLEQNSSILYTDPEIDIGASSAPGFFLARGSICKASDSSRASHRARKNNKYTRRE